MSGLQAPEVASLLDDFSKLVQAVERISDTVLPPREEVLTRDELAKRLQCSTRYLDTAKDVPCFRVGRLKRYRWPSVLDYFQEEGGSK